MLQCTVQTRFGQPTALFAVPLLGREPAYMSFPLHVHRSSHSAVCIVSSSKFLELWQQEPYSIHRPQSFGNQATWREDYKFHHADQGFAQGPTNPVPLAYVSFAVEQRIEMSYRFLWYGKTYSMRRVPHVGFTNGVTRTIWLLANGCNAFPVECELPGAEELQRYAGVPGTSLLTVSGLLAKNAA
jgi:hypothetical protein